MQRRTNSNVREAEVVVIGGGIAGASAAYELARHGHGVTVVERAEIASGASGVNAGTIHSVGWGDEPDLYAHLTAGSVEQLEQVQLEHGIDIELRSSGSLTAIHTPDQHAWASERVRALQAGGYRLDLLTLEEARAIEPELAPGLLGAIHAPLAAQADPVKATRAFAELAAAAGASLRTNEEITALRPRSPSGWLVQTTAGGMAAGAVVIAAGAWSGPVGALAGLEIPIVAVRGQMWATAPTEPTVFQSIFSAESPHAWELERERSPGEPPELTHRVGKRVTRHLYGRQRRNGELVFGGDRELAGWDRVPSQAGIEVNRRHAAEVVPLLAELPIVRTWAGLMPFSLDGKPLIGRIPAREDLWIVGGLASGGFGAGPMAGKLLADALRGQPATVLAEADPGRSVRELERAELR
jgi:glycine/D-amino acid oxidase-like deaminating enzyme